MTTPTRNDFRELCAELLREWDAANGDQDLLAVAEVIGRMRTSLAQPDPEASGYYRESLPHWALHHD